MTQGALRLAWPLPFEALVLAIAGRAGLARHELTPLAPWIARAASGGPTPAHGPVAHALELPGREAPHGFGLVVLAHVSRSGRALPPLLVEGERWAAHVLGQVAGATVASLGARARGIGWQGGVSWAGGAWRLGLHGAGSAPDVAATARALGADLTHVELEAGLVALSLDVTASGIEDVRTFERLDLGAEAPPGAERRLLGRAGGARGRRTVVTGFKPGVTASALPGHDVDAEWLRALVTSIAEAGFALHLASHSLDVYDDGARATRIAVTLGGDG